MKRSFLGAHMGMSSGWEIPLWYSGTDRHIAYLKDIFPNKEGREAKAVR